MKLSSLTGAGGAGGAFPSNFPSSSDHDSSFHYIFQKVIFRYCTKAETDPHPLFAFARSTLGSFRMEYWVWGGVGGGGVVVVVVMGVIMVIGQKCS